MNTLQKLRLIAKSFKILYVEDNKALRTKASVLLNKFFGRVDLAEDGKEGLEKFKAYHYPIVITDIKMPHIDGMTLSKYIRHINPDTKIIIMSAFDDKKLLFKGIELGIFRFLKKPVDVNELSEVLFKALTEIKHERSIKLFYTHIQNILNYQSSMVVMFNGSKAILANQIFLEFFDLESIEDFYKKYEDIGSQFLSHDGFLYDFKDESCLNILENNEKKLFHVKMKNKDENIRHFILKYQNIPEKDNYKILSFDDVTELNLLKLFDNTQTKNDTKQYDQKAIFDLFKVVQRNSAKIEIHNYYKGLSITNDAVVASIDENSITIKTTFLQQKAIQHEGKVFLISEAFPHVLESLDIRRISFEKQTVELKSLRFVKTSPVNRKTIRVEPEENHTASLFIGENKFHGDVYIEDISLEAVKLNLNALPPTLEEGSEVTVDLVLSMDKKPFILNTQAVIFSIVELKSGYNVVCVFKQTKKNEMVKYITKRQMAIIREFKGLQNG